MAGSFRKVAISLLAVAAGGGPPGGGAPRAGPPPTRPPPAPPTGRPAPRGPADRSRAGRACAEAHEAVAAVHWAAAAGRRRRLRAELQLRQRAGRLRPHRGQAVQRPDLSSTVAF